MSKLIKQLTADKKRLSIMLGLLGVGLLLWGRLLLKQIPRTAVAKPSTELVEALNKMDPSPNGSAQSQDLIRRPVVYLDLASLSDRNLFDWDPQGYPRARDYDPNRDAGTGKSPSNAADDQLQVVTRAKSALALQTTIVSGDRPRAMINGQLLAPGQRIQEFVLTKIMDRKVTLEYRPNPQQDYGTSAIQVQLEMQ